MESKSQFRILILFLFGTFTVLSLCSAKLTYSPVEKRALKEFRPLVKRLLTHGYQTTDSYLIRYLKAKKLNVGEAYEMLREAQEWRKENKIDGIANEEFPEAITKFRFTDDGVDNEGRTVFTSSLGDFNVRKVALSGKQELYNRYVLHVTEKAVSKAAEAVYRSNGTLTDSRLVSITDIQGFSLRNHACIACIEMLTRVTRVVEKNYPGIAGLDISINTPRIAIPFYNLFINFVSEETRNAIKVFGTNRTEWTEYIRSVIPPDQISYQFGGTRVYNYTTQEKKA